jgi:hypothetical protein
VAFGFARPTRHDPSRDGWLYLVMSAYLLMTIRNREITKLVLIKHLHTAELILAADTTSLRTSSTPLTNDHPRFILEPYSRGPQTETRTHHDCAYPSTHES